MTKEEFETRLEQLNLAEDIKEYLKRHAEAEGQIFYNSLTNKNFGRKISIEIIMKKKADEIIAFLNKNQIPQVEDSMKTSAHQGLEKQDTPCFLKAYAIEFILKTIETIRDRKVLYPNTDHLEILKQELNNLWRNKYRNGGNGHEINDLLNYSIPKHLQNIIRLGALSNLNDEIVRNSGLVDVSNMTNFVFDYNALQSNMTPEELAYYNKQMDFLNQILEKNNKTFQDARYLNSDLTCDDFICLNCFMASSYALLKFLMNYPELSQDFDRIIPYNIIGESNLQEIITQEEYDEIIKLYAGQPNSTTETNSLLTYILFLKHNLKDRMPSITPERLRNIKENLEKLPIDPTPANFQSTCQLDIDKNFEIDINDLNSDDLNELIKINPQFVYEQLSTNNQIILETCQRYGIKFEKYYEHDFDKFMHILENYGEYFKDKSIDPTFLLENEKTTLARLELYKKYNQLGNVPSYYFRFSPNELAMALECFSASSHDSNIMSEEYLEKIVIRNKLRKENPKMSAEELEKNIEIEYQRITKARIEEKRRLTEDTSDNQSTLSTSNYFTNYVIKYLNNRFHTDMTDYLIGLDKNILQSIIDNVKKISFIRKKTDSKFPQNKFSNLLPKPFPPVEPQIGIEPGMKPISLSERCKSLHWLNLLEQEQLEGAEYTAEQKEKFMFYKRDSEIQRITYLYRKYAQESQNEALPFYLELLYFPMDVLENNMETVLDKIDDAYQSEREYSYEEAQKISKKIRKRSTLYQIRSNVESEINGMFNGYGNKIIPINAGIPQQEMKKAV